jgi:hypothetical protein
MVYMRGSTVDLTPPVAPPLYESWNRVQHIFHGWDGSTWDVTDGRNGVYLMPAGIEGMGMPEIEQYTFDSPVIHGFEWEGWRATGRDVHWVIGIFEDDSIEWLKLKSAFWKLFQPGKTLVWEIILPNDEKFRITVRFKSDDTSVYSRDPVRLGWAIYGITGMCEQPFWEGTTQSPIWYPGSSSDFIPVGGAPPFNISAAASISTAKITNPGDVEAYLRWELKGPFTTAAVGLQNKLVTVGATTLGQTVVINTDPKELTATRDGVDIMPSLGDFEFWPVPPGEDITLQLSMSGTGSIQAFFTPLYFRSI